MEGSRTWDLSSKSALTQISSPQIPRAFNKHRIAKKIRAI